jgi:hypothetical protein
MFERHEGQRWFNVGSKVKEWSDPEIHFAMQFVWDGQGKEIQAECANVREIHVSTGAERASHWQLLPPHPLEE